MRKQLSEKLKEAVASVIPVTLIVLLLQIIDFTYPIALILVLF